MRTGQHEVSKLRRIPRTVLLQLILLLASAALMSARAEGQNDRGVTDVRTGERIVFFTTAARLRPDAKGWIVPVHGWIYRPTQSITRKHLIEQVLASTYGLRVDPETRPRFDERVNLLLAHGLGGRRVVARIGTRVFSLPASGDNGHFVGAVELSSEEATASAKGSRLEIEAVLPKNASRTFGGTAVLIGATGLTVISDIDDTLKVTHVTNRREMFNQTFLQPFAAVAGMAELYRAWAERGAVYHFVSSSPWALYEPLSEFFERSKFPVGILSLKTASLTDRSILNFLKSGSQTKPPEIEALLAAYPSRRFMLVGDSGEQDPEVYAATLRKHPDRIEMIYIRNVTGAAASDVRFNKVFEGIDPKRWQLFSEPSEITQIP